MKKYIATFGLDMQNFSDPFLRGIGTNTMHLNWIDWGSNMDRHLVLNIWVYIGMNTLRIRTTATARAFRWRRSRSTRRQR